MTSTASGEFEHPGYGLLEIELAEGRLHALFNGTDLAGWTRLNGDDGPLPADDAFRVAAQIIKLVNAWPRSTLKQKVTA